MQLSPRLGRTAAVLGAFLGVALACAETHAAPIAVDEMTADYLLQYFTDSDDVSVRSLIGNFSMATTGNSSLDVHWNNELVVIPAIEAPAGSQEAVDAITTASRPISGNAGEDYVKTRNEFVAQLSHRSSAIEYYLSTEDDYLGQQLGFSHNRDLLDDQLNVSVGTSYGWDAIDPLLDDDTQTAADTKTTLHWNAVATQILSPTMLLRVGVEYNMIRGLQHNPYRNVYAGGTNVPERHPDRRLRRDVFVKLNNYLGNRSSLKFNYRLYNDDWGITSHEMGGKLSQYITHGLFASYRYRYYTQSAADFYRQDYATTSGIGGFLSGDYRMSELSSHLFGVALDFDLRAMAVNQAVLDRMKLRLNYQRYFNNRNYSANILTTQLVYLF